MITELRLRMPLIGVIRREGDWEFKIVSGLVGIYFGLEGAFWLNCLTGLLVFFGGLGLRAEF